MGTIGIKDIAREANVSPATVSNVLNGRKNVGSETRKRILSLCQEMHYQPSVIGQALKNGRNRIILFNFSDFDRQFYLKIIQGINDYAYEHDYDLIICTSKSCEKFMNKSSSCGCIMLDAKCRDEMLIRKAQVGYPIIALDRPMSAPYIKSVTVNNYAPEAEMMEGLISRGYTRFAYLNGFESVDNEERLQAVKDVLKKHNLTLPRENRLIGDYREKSGNQAARLLMLSENLPEVLVCANDNMAIGAIRAFRENGLRVPEDIAVCGFDDSDMAKVYGLTTVSIPNYERGYLAAQYLVENVNGAGNYAPFRITAKVKWRSTTK